MQENIEIKNAKSKWIFALIICLIFVVLMLISGEVKANSENEYLDLSNIPYDTSKNEYKYLSDMSYEISLSKPASTSEKWGIITMDKNADDDSALSLRVNGTAVTFEKGIFAHATSTVVYNIENCGYDYFSTYYGVSSLRGSNGGVKFYIYTSKDGEIWDLQTPEEPTVMTGASNAEYIKIDINGVKYLKLYADSYGSNAQDHSIYADAKLFKEGYKENVTPTVEEYDKYIKSKYSGNITDDIELALLQREFVKNVGDYTLKTFVEKSDENKETLNWLMQDKETLRLYLVGGKPEGSYLNSLNILSTMYNKYKDTDLKNENTTEYGTKLKDLYRTMILSISLTHSGKVYLWVDGSVISDPVTRYEIYKDLHSEKLIENEIFESLTVEEMRWVMNTVVDDEEIKWLNDYVRNDKNGATSPYSYIRYTFGYDYRLDKYYSQENYEQWDRKYHLSKWNITYKTGNPKLWIVFEEGAVCGGISKTGSCIWGSYKGLPNTCVSQPGHCAYIYYTQDANGNGVWNLGNDVSGWSQTGKTEHLNVRIMNDWGSTVPGWTASYVLLAQAAQNEYEKYEKSEETLMLADVYKNDSENLETIYRKALSEEEINFDAWSGLVDLYLKDENKKEEDYYNLAEEIATTLTYYPRPMYDLITKLEPKLTSAGMQAKFTMLKTRVLTQAVNATNEETIQVSAVKQVAGALLGMYDKNVATFSFDGENGGKIVLGSKFGDSDVAWDYSLDGGKKWNQTTEKAYELKMEEIASITAENDIKVHIIGVDYSESNIFTIDIKESAGLPSNIYANDLENKIIGATDTMEWRYTENDEWTSYKDAEPNLTGNKSVMVRVTATGVYLESKTSTTYTFTEDNQAENRKYIPISHLSVHQVSSEATSNNGNAVNAIDGNINTIWHSAYNGSDSERYISIKLDESKYISALEYVPRQSGNNGRIKNAILMTSMDGVNWSEVATVTNWADNASTKVINLDEPVEAQYIKLVTTSNYGDGRNFVSALMINLFEDTTKTQQEPQEPENPEQPENPNEPENPEQPENPDEPEKPEDPSQPDQPEIPTPTEQPTFSSEVYEVGENISKVAPKTTVDEFKKNVKTNQQLIFTNKDGEVLTGDMKIGTGTILKVENIKQYTIIVTGDTDGDGETTINDLAKIKLHCINYKLLEGEYFKAANLDEDTKVTINDLAKMKLMLINL